MIDNIDLGQKTVLSTQSMHAILKITPPTLQILYKYDIIITFHFVSFLQENFRIYMF